MGRGGVGVVVSLHLPPTPSPSPVLGYPLFVSHSVDKHLNVILTTQTIKFVEIRAVFTVPTLRAAAAGGCSQEVGVNVGFVTNKEFLPRIPATSSATQTFYIRDHYCC